MLNFFAPANNLGYGVHSVSLMNALSKKGLPLSLITPSGRNDLGSIDVDIWMNNAQYSHPKEPAIMIFHENYLKQFSGSPRIGYPVFEVDKFSHKDVSCLKSCDYIFQTSKWGKDIVSRYVEAEKIFVIPEGYDDAIYFPKGVEVVSRKMKDSIDFIFIGKFEERKSVKELIAGYARAVSGFDRTTNFYLKCHNPFDRSWMEAVGKEIALHNGFQLSGRVNIFEDGFEKSYQALRFVKGKAEITVMDDQNSMTREDYALFISTKHFGLFASKAEGWNLPLIECLASGVPCVTTRVTAQGEYIPEDYSDQLLLTEVTPVTAYDGIWFFGKGNWMRPSVGEIELKIKRLLKNPEDAYRFLSPYVSKMVENFTWDNAAVKVIEALEKIGIKEEVLYDRSEG